MARTMSPEITSEPVSYIPATKASSCPDPKNVSVRATAPGLTPLHPAKKKVRKKGSVIKIVISINETWNVLAKDPFDTMF